MEPALGEATAGRLPQVASLIRATKPLLRHNDLAEVLVASLFSEGVRDLPTGSSVERSFSCRTPRRPDVL